MTDSIQIVSLGPGDPELMNLKTVRALEQAETLILRTERHPAAAWLREKGIPFSSLDAFYEEAEDFDALYARIAEKLWQEARGRSLVYAVPDALSDRSVDGIFRLRPEGAAVSVIPGVGYPDAAMAADRSRLSGEGLRAVPACALTEDSYDPALPLLITEADSAALAGDLKIILSGYLEDETEITYLPDLSAPAPERVRLYEMDRQRQYSHLTAFLIPGTEVTERPGCTLEDLDRIMTRLRAPGGCPWDRQQTHASLRPYLVEEAWEAVNAIDAEDSDHLADELGDVLLQIVFHASIARDFDEFTLRDVISAICRKMIHRHPHVFGDAEFASAREVSDVWEKIKREETGSRTVGESLEDASSGLPSLKYAMKVHKKIRQLPGLRRTAAALAEDLRRLSGSVLADRDTLNGEIMGRLLLACAELCQVCGADGELLLHQAAEEYKKRFRAAENFILSDGKSPESLTIRELSVYFKRVEEGN